MKKKIMAIHVVPGLPLDYLVMTLDACAHLHVIADEQARYFGSSDAVAVWLEGLRSGCEAQIHRLGGMGALAPMVDRREGYPTDPTMPLEAPCGRLQAAEVVGRGAGSRARSSRVKGADSRHGKPAVSLQVAGAAL